MEETATLKGVKCPHCGAEDFGFLGLKGAIATSAAIGTLGGIAQYVAGKTAATDTETVPLNYLCKKCAKKFQTLPLTAPAEDLLTESCTIALTRTGGGGIIPTPRIVYLNGKKVGPVYKNKTLTFTTNNRHNVIYVTDQNGIPLCNEGYKFEVTAGEQLALKFKRKVKIA